MTLGAASEILTRFRLREDDASGFCRSPSSSLSVGIKSLLGLLGTGDEDRDDDEDKECCEEQIKSFSVDMVRICSLSLLKEVL